MAGQSGELIPLRLYLGGELRPISFRLGAGNQALLRKQVLSPFASGPTLMRLRESTSPAEIQRKVAIANGRAVWFDAT